MHNRRPKTCVASLVVVRPSLGKASVPETSPQQAIAATGASASVTWHESAYECDQNGQGHGSGCFYSCVQPQEHRINEEYGGAKHRDCGQWAGALGSGNGRGRFALGAGAAQISKRTRRACDRQLQHHPRPPLLMRGREVTAPRAAHILLFLPRPARRSCSLTLPLHALCHSTSDSPAEPRSPASSCSTNTPPRRQPA